MCAPVVAGEVVLVGEPCGVADLGEDPGLTATRASSPVCARATLSKVSLLERLQSG